MKTYKGYITKLEDNQIFVCGTNTQGRHGKGAALWAEKNAGLKYGHMRGICNQTYAIITKDLNKIVHPSISGYIITEQIKDLYTFAENNKDKEFLIAYSSEGFNLNGYSDKEMASFFSSNTIPENIVFEEGFSKLLS